MLSWHPFGRRRVGVRNALSVFLPVGERVCIDALRHYREQDVTQGEGLMQALCAVVGQEAMHGWEHDGDNAAEPAAGVRADSMGKLVDTILRGVRRIFPRGHQTVATMAPEYCGAMLVPGLLDAPALLDRADARFAVIWRWHALGRTECKAGWCGWRPWLGQTALG